MPPMSESNRPTGGDREPLVDVPMSWPVLGSRQVYRGHWVVGVRTDEVHRPGHPEDPFTRVVVEDPGAVVILAIDEAERVVVLRQYRHPVGAELVELPAGKCDVPGEDPLLTAQRELAEEAGLVAESWRFLFTTYPTPGISSEAHHYYLATGLSDADHDYEPHHEEAEARLERVPVGELVEAIAAGTVADGPLITAVLAYRVFARGE